MARRLGIKFYRTCVKENLNVTEGMSQHVYYKPSTPSYSITSLPSVADWLSLLPAVSVFVYLAELHDKRVMSGQLPSEPAVGSIEPAATPTTAYHDDDKQSSSSRPAGGAVDSNSFAAGSKGSSQQVAPVTVDLKPSKKRGKKKLQTKAAGLTKCSIS